MEVKQEKKKRGEGEERERNTKIGERQGKGGLAVRTEIPPPAAHLEGQNREGEVKNGRQGKLRGEREGLRGKGGGEREQSRRTN